MGLERGLLELALGQWRLNAACAWSSEGNLVTIQVGGVKSHMADS